MGEKRARVAGVACIVLCSVVRWMGTVEAALSGPPAAAPLTTGPFPFAVQCSAAERTTGDWRYGINGMAWDRLTLPTWTWPRS